MADPTSALPTESEKPIHTIILDASPLLLNTPGISTLLVNSHVLMTTPSVLSEIRTEEARTRIDTFYKPFLTVRTPKPESIKLVKDFARKTGDGSVLSQTDFEILALAYDVEVERNHGDWRLRSTPGQKRVNGKPPAKTDDGTVPGISPAQSVESPSGDDAKSVVKQDEEVVDRETQNQEIPASVVAGEDSTTLVSQNPPTSQQESTPSEMIITETVDDGEDSTTPVSQNPPTSQQESTPSEMIITETVDDGEDSTTLVSQNPPTSQQESTPSEMIITETVDDGSDSDEGWITPSNIKKRQNKDENGSNKSQNEIKHLQVATMTGDFAMQNVLLQMNLNLLSTKTCKRISQIKQFILRCHACFATTKDMSKQFCARCGKPTLTRVSCTTNDKGEVKLHLKANMQWNNKGNIFPVPKPTAGTSNQKWKGPRQGGGQGGWGNELILAEDQKEYIRAMSTIKRTKEKDLMDQDTLPSILTGNRDHGSGKVRVGGGRNINSRKR